MLHCRLPSSSHATSLSFGTVSGSVNPSGSFSVGGGATAQKRCHGVTSVPSIAAAMSWFLLGVTFQPVSFHSNSVEHPGIDLSGTHGDSGAGLKSPPSAKLSMHPCCLRNAAPRINPYGSPSTTRTVILLTRSSGMNTNVMSHDLTCLLYTSPSPRD